MMMKFILCLSLLIVPMSSSIDNKISDLKANYEFTKNEKFLRGFDWIRDKFLHIIEFFVPDHWTKRIEGRKHKKIKLNKYVFPLIIGFLLIKSVILPLALKALAILSGKAVVLSLMSLILAAIIGLRTVANGHITTSAQSKIDLDNMTKYKRKDIFFENADQDLYRYYGDIHRRR